MTLSVAGQGNRIDGTNGDDNIVGTDAAESIHGFRGQDTIEGRGGADIIYGAETIAIDDSYDTASYEHSPAGVQVDLQRNIQHGGDAEGDLLFNIEGVTGSAYDDTITGNDGSNTLRGGWGLDTLNGGGGPDSLFGGFDGRADVLDGGTGVDTVNYSQASGSMTVVLGHGPMFVYEPFFHVLPAADGSATLDAHVASGTFGPGLTYQFNVPAVQEDVLRNIENVYGTQFGDHITGNELANNLYGEDGDDVIDGGLGDDLIMGGSGADTIKGGDGIDTATYGWGISEGVRIDLSHVTQHGGEAEGDQLTSIENVIGTAAADDLRGNGDDNRLVGSLGDDTINGGGGKDVIESGWGADTLDGGTGADTFVYSMVEDSGQGIVPNYPWPIFVDFGHDTILNFETGVDKIDLTAVDADSTVDGNQAFHWVDHLTGHAGEIAISGSTLVANVDGIANELILNVTGVHHGDVLL